MKPTHILLALLTVIIWGSNFVVIKIGLQHLPPLLFTALRFIFTALPLVLFIKPPAVRWQLLAVYALGQFTLAFGLLFIGIKLGLAAGLASLVMQLQVFFTIGLAIWLLAERPKPAQLVGAMIALLGMALVGWHLDAHGTLLGFVLAIVAAFCWASANIATKRMGPVDSIALVVWGSLIAAPPLVLASLVFESSAPWLALATHPDWRTLWLALFQAYPNTLLGFGIWSMLMKHYPAATVAPFSLLVPVTGMLCAALVVDEPLYWWKIVAGALVLTGLGLNQFGTRMWALAGGGR